MFPLASVSVWPTQGFPVIVGAMVAAARPEEAVPARSAAARARTTARTAVRRVTGDRGTDMSLRLPSRPLDE